MNFLSVLPIHIAMAMKEDTPFGAVKFLCRIIGITKPQRAIPMSDAVWVATSLPVRHGLIMAWLAEESAA